MPVGRSDAGSSLATEFTPRSSRWIKLSRKVFLGDIFSANDHLSPNLTIL
jgi:hypothetical protein